MAGSGGDGATEGGGLLVGVQLALVSAHLLVLTRLLRRSADRDYAGLEPENWVERRIVLTLVRMGQASVGDLAASLGNDMAQVSRSLSALRKRGLVLRDGPRSPCRLSDEGRSVAARLDRLALERDHALIEGFGSLELFEFGGILASLSARAIDIHNAEAERGKDAQSRLPRRFARPEIYGRMIPAVFGLSNYIARGATLAIKRLTDLSQYEWRVLAFIASRPAIGFSELVERTDSDKAQLSRALDTLGTAGLVHRSETPPVLFTISAEGETIHAVMQQDALARNAALLSDLSPEQVETTRSGFRRLIENAQKMDGFSAPES